MTISEMVAEIIERADEVDNQPLDAVEKLVHRLADAADKLGVNPATAAGDRGGFSAAEQQQITPAVIERAERELQRRSERSAAKLKKVNEARRLPLLPKRDDGWWIDGSAETPDVPEWGPWDTKKEAEEARASYIRSNKPVSAKEQAKIEAKEKARQRGTGAKPSEPIAAESVTTKPAGKQKKESEVTVKNDHPKKTATAKSGKQKASAEGAKSKPAAKQKQAAAPKAKKTAKDPGEKKLSALDAAHEVLKHRTKPMSAKELIEVMAEKKLWSSPGGKTPDATLAAALVREINTKGKDSRFTKPEAGRFAAK